MGRVLQGFFDRSFLPVIVEGQGQSFEEEVLRKFISSLRSSRNGKLSDFFQQRKNALKNKNNFCLIFNFFRDGGQNKVIFISAN